MRQSPLIGKKQSEKGFSIVELVIVVTLISIISLISLMSFGANKLYDADKQALQIASLLQEARQRSLSQRKTMRIEINPTKNLVRLIDEKLPGNAADDIEIQSVAYRNDGVYIGTSPSNMTANPTELSPVPPVTFSTSTHPLSVGDNVATLRFMRNGTVTDSGTDAIGTNSIATGATIFVWSKYPDDASSTPTVAQIFRAVTVLGSSGSSRLWKCSITAGDCSSWSN